MLRLTVRGVQGHLIRFLLTALAVTLGVAFVAGSFVLRDSINVTLDNLLSSADKGVDVMVRGTLVPGQGSDGPRRPVTIALTDRLGGVPGVAKASPDIQGLAMLVGRDGTVVRNGGAPTLGFPFRADSPAFRLTSGRGPTGPGEIVVEAATLAKSGLAVGDTTRVIVGGAAHAARIVGEVEFGSLFGATAVLVDEATARAAFAPDGNVASISLTAAPGVTQATLRARVAAVLPGGTEAITGAALAKEQQTSVQRGLSFVTTFLLVFAGITLFVGAFIIVNTFSILLAQRTRELALLRAVGASRAQVRRMVLGEAIVVGLLGSAAGLVVGIALAAGLKSVMKSLIGVDIAGGLPVHPSTVAISVVVGVAVTAAAAVLPAVRAGRIPPVVAMREDMVAAPSSIRRRGTVGLVLLAAGAALLSWGVSRHDVNWTLGGSGAALVAIGSLVAAPLAARPVVRLLVWPFLRFGGVVGRLAGQNALRVPRRTANTASALMIGLTLVAALAVVASSAKASFADVVARQLTSDYVLTAGGQPVPADLSRQVPTLPGVGGVATLGALDLSVGALHTQATVSDGAGLAANVRLDLISGSVAAIDSGQVLVDRTTATSHGWHLGSEIDAAVGTLSQQRLTVGGVFTDSQLLGTPFIVGQDLAARALPATDRQVDFLLIKAAPGADTTALHAGLVRLAKPYVVVSVQTGAEYVGTAASQVDQLLALLYVLLALAIVIAVLGIINTLALSVVERTREIGLLRAVGLRRRQLAGMITLEAVATALFGAVLGAALGVYLGTSLQHGLRGQGLAVLDIPWTTVAVVLVTSGVVGVVAAALPAVRAVRLNILAAIATE